MAEREGFEPSVDLRPQRFSRPPRSTTPAPLHWLYAWDSRASPDARRRCVHRLADLPSRGNSLGAENTQNLVRARWRKFALPLMNLGTVAHHASRATSPSVNSSVDVIKPPRQVPKRGALFKFGKAEP